MNADTRTLKGRSGAMEIPPSRRGSAGSEERRNAAKPAPTSGVGVGTPEPDQWFVSVQGRPWGPMCFRTLVRLVHLRAVHARTLAWCAGRGGWQPLWCQRRLRQILSRSPYARRL